MYKPVDMPQSSFLDFNQPMGLHMNPDNRWIKMADAIPWDMFEKKYSRLFKVKTGNVIGLPGYQDEPENKGTKGKA